MASRAESVVTSGNTVDRSIDFRVTIGICGGAVGRSAVGVLCRCTDQSHHHPRISDYGGTPCTVLDFTPTTGVKLRAVDTEVRSVTDSIGLLVVAEMVLSFILVQNRQGKTRLAKWYAPYTDEEKVKLKGEVRKRLITEKVLSHAY